MKDVIFKKSDIFAVRARDGFPCFLTRFQIFLHYPNILWEDAILHKNFKIFGRIFPSEITHSKVWSFFGCYLGIV